MSKSPWDVDIDALVADRKAFNAFVYTPLDEAILELKQRRADTALTEKVHGLLGGDIPEPFQIGPRAVLFRQLATPNYETRHFMDVLGSFPTSPKPLFWEYYEDKFTPNNYLKLSLGKLKFLLGIGKKQGRNATAILSTNVGILAGKEAIKRKVGGELLFKIW